MQRIDVPRKRDYINAAKILVEIAATELEGERVESGLVKGAGRYLGLAEILLRATVEMLSMRVQYFRNAMEQGVEAGRQMAFLVEQGHDAVFVKSHRSARETLTTKREVEAARQMAKLRLKMHLRIKGAVLVAALRMISDVGRHFGRHSSSDSRVVVRDGA